MEVAVIHSWRTPSCHLCCVPSSQLASVSPSAAPRELLSDLRVRCSNAPALSKGEGELCALKFSFALNNFNPWLVHENVRVETNSKESKLPAVSLLWVDGFGAAVAVSG